MAKWQLNYDQVVIAVLWHREAEKKWSTRKKKLFETISNALKGPVKNTQGWSKDKRFLRRQKFESDTESIEIFFEQKLRPLWEQHVGHWMIGRIRITCKDPVRGYPEHHRTMLAVENILTQFGFSCELDYAEVCIDTTNRREYDRIFKKSLMNWSRPEDCEYWDNDCGAKVTEFSPDYEAKYCKGRRSPRQFVMYWKKNERIGRCEIRLNKQYLRRTRIRTMRKLMSTGKGLIKKAFRVLQVRIKSVLRLRQMHKMAGTCTKFCRISRKKIEKWAERPTVQNLSQLSDLLVKTGFLTTADLKRKLFKVVDFPDVVCATISTEQSNKTVERLSVERLAQKRSTYEFDPVVLLYREEEAQGGWNAQHNCNWKSKYFQSETRNRLSNLGIQSLFRLHLVWNFARSIMRKLKFLFSTETGTPPANDLRLDSG
jgi:hypothetical protein